jgi:hypothetical protein
LSATEFSLKDYCAIYITGHTSLEMFAMHFLAHKLAMDVYYFAMGHLSDEHWEQLTEVLGNLHDCHYWVLATTKLSYRELENQMEIATYASSQPPFVTIDDGAIITSGADICGDDRLLNLTHTFSGVINLVRRSSLN